LRRYILSDLASKFGCSYEEAQRRFGDPIHSSEVYLNDEMLSKLKEEGIVAWRIEQALGEGVFLPASSIYQVCPLANCVLIRTPFLSPQSITTSLRTLDSLRELNHKKKWWHRDAVRFRWMVGFSDIGSILTPRQ
ncbi:hypothetical protein BT69DRAFT_1218325, partial [Atractiella rhizophila]